MNNNNYSWALICIPALFSDFAVAEELPMEEVNVTAYRTAMPEQKVGASTVSLDADSLLRQGIDVVADALAQAPSISVSSSGGPGSLTQIRIRGQEADHTLVLLDGIRINDPTTGFVDFANLRMDGISKIEIVYGPQSMVYGGDALAGVVNIITEAADDGVSGSVSTQYGSNDTYGYDASIAGGYTSENVRVYGTALLNHYDTDGISAASEQRGNTESDPYQSDTAHVKVGLDIGQTKLWAVYHKGKNVVDFDTDDYSTGLVQDEPDGFRNVQERHSTYQLVGVSQHFDENSKIQLTYLTTDDDVHTESYSAWSTPAGMSPYDSRGQRERIDGFVHLQFTDAQSIQFGVNLQEESVSTSYFMEQTSDTEGAYIQWLGDFNALNLSLGIRQDDDDSFGNFTTYRATFSYQLTDSWRVISSYGTGFKAPSLFELYDFGGNPDLEPEESESMDIAAEYQTDGMNLHIGLFQQDTDNLIRSIGSYPNSQMQNVDKSTAKGAELTWAANLAHDILLNTSYTYIDAVEKTNNSGIITESDALRVPDNQFHIDVSWLANEQWELWGRFDWVDSRTDYNWYFESYPELDTYTLVGLGANYTPLESLLIQLTMDNALDEEYESVQGFGTLGRTITVKVRYSF